ncbi:hypothetical protein [Thiocystis violacea]|uniref:hypothetical protein n=1 Tax=Thiocystis violacea TaxID=13725 RepID=UPI0019080568|nr:hypothetical protein [Thiocystis violacea]MBK1724157.1 hypothetical protein [Thiocystis violacea]
MEDSLSIVIADTSVLINFLAIDRMDLIKRHACRFFITDHVRSEVTVHFQEQLSRLENALQQGILEEVSVTQADEVETFAHWTSLKRFGYGECSCIAVALHRDYTLAMDDKRAIKQAQASCPSIHIITTQALIVSMIREHLLTVDEADTIKSEWASTHKFLLKFDSFRSLL